MSQQDQITDLSVDAALEVEADSIVEEAAENQAAEDDGIDVDAMPGGLRGAVEAVLMVVEEPVPVTRLAAAVRRPVPEVLQTVQALAAEYLDTERGFELREVAGGWRVFSRAEHADVVEQFVLDGQTARLTQAALETLAVVAYRQPVSRSRVSAVRGVSVDGVIRTLLSRGLIDEVGTDPSSGAVLYGTTGQFLERMGMSDLAELPPLAPFLPDGEELADLIEEQR